MAKAYSVDGRGYITNHYLAKHLDDRNILVTSDHGGWAVLNPEEFRLLRHGKVESDISLLNILLKEGIILNESNLPVVPAQCKSKFAQLFNATTLHIITPTLRCNHRCVYCYASSKPEAAKEYDMTKETAKEVVDFIFQCPSRFITIEFQGGEPLLNFEIIQFIVNYSEELNKIKKKDVKFRIVTNLSLMSEDILEWLIQNKIDINTSLDGPKEVHDKNRIFVGCEGSHDIVVDWCKKLRARGVQIGIMPTITKHSLPYWKEIIDEYVSLGAEKVWARKANFGGFAAEGWDKIGYTPEEFFDFWKKSIDYVLDLNKKGTRIAEIGVELIVGNIIYSKSCGSSVCLSSPCGCGWSQVAYNYKGDIYTCDEARSFELFRLGNVKENTYSEIYSSRASLDLVDLSSGMSFDCAKCAYHPFCGPCIVDEFGEHGSIIKRPNSVNCELKKAMFDYVFKNIILDENNFKIVRGWIGLGEGTQNIVPVQEKHE